MDVQLKELIETIKKDGIENAQQQAETIVRKAEEQAKEIIAVAESKSTEIISSAKEEAEKSEQAGNEALKQSGRDLMLNLRNQIEEMFTRIIEQEAKEALSGNIIEDGIVSILKGWKDDIADLSVLLPEDTLKKIESGLKNKLSNEIKKGIKIKPFPGIESGFRISEKDGAAFYDFSGKEMSDILSKYLNPRLGELLKG